MTTMGEARRRARRIAEGAPVQYRNTVTGAIEQGRAAPSVHQLLGAWEDLVAAERRGERPEAKVPCNGCTACCHMAKIDFDPARERPEDLAHLDYEPDPEAPGRALMKRRDGACVHLGPRGCTVYEHRPRCCRVYDCRIFAVTGITEIFEGGYAQPRWVLSTDNEEDRICAAALHAASIIEFKEAKGNGEEFDAQVVALRAWETGRKLLPALRGLMGEMKKMPKDQLAALHKEVEPASRRFLEGLGQ